MRIAIDSKPYKYATAIALLVLCLGACTVNAGPKVAWASELITIELSDGERQAFTVELARTPAQRRRGLMNREHLPGDAGMLFDFGSPRKINMWMVNTLISLDMLFIDRNGVIVKIANSTEPLSRKLIRSPGPARAVLELNGGVALKLGIAVGDQVKSSIFDRPN